MGVDLGLTGGITIVDDNGLIIVCEPMPIIEIIVNKKKRNQYDIQAINELFRAWISEYNIVRACVERLRPIPNQSSQTAFSMGGSTMLFKTIFTVYKIPFVEIEARTWQKEIFKRAGVQYTGKTTKIASIAAAKTLYPGVSFRKNERCRTDSDGMTDSAHLSTYLKIIN